MTSRTYLNKAGRTMHKPVMSIEEIESDDTAGFCLACGLDVCSGVEPDARAYECESCGEKKVYGLQELLLMGLVVITEDGDESES